MDLAFIFTIPLPLAFVATSTILAVAAVASTAVATYSTVAQAQAAKKAGVAANKNAQAENNNAELENAEAMKRERAKAARHMATVRARLAGTGTDTNQGTPLTVLGENANNIELSFQDAARRNAMQSASMLQAGAMAQWSGNQAYKAGMISAAGTALKGLSGAASEYDDAVYTGRAKDTFGLYRTKPNGQ